MRYQRLVLFRQGVPLQEIAMKLWSGGTMLLKKLDTDERIFFSKFDGPHRSRRLARSYQQNPER